MKSLTFLEQADHNRKAAMYAAAHDGKLRNFVYDEELGECRETFSRLLGAVQEGEIGVVLTPDAACLAIETSAGWMEVLIQAVKQHGVLIGDHGGDLVYDLREEADEARFRALFSPEDYQRERLALTKVALEPSDVPAEALALLSAWIEEERLLVDGREDVGGIAFCRMDARVMAPLSHILASFFARRPYKRKEGHYPNWNGFYLLLYRDVEEGWKLLRMGRDTSYAQFVPLFAARSKAAEEINKLRGSDRDDT